MFGIIEADEQVGANTHKLPEEIHLEDVGSHYQSEHTHGEERQKSIETLEAFLVAFLLIVLVTLSHVAQAVDMHHQTDRCDDDEHHHTDGSQAEAYSEGEELTEFQPRKVEDSDGREQSLIGAIY